MGGVFDRRVGEPLTLEPSSPPERPKILVNDNGDTNQLIVRINLDDSEVIEVITGSSAFFASRTQAEEAVLEALNTNNSRAVSYFAGATHAWHLISSDRLGEEGREFLGDEHPEETLHQYIVLSYPSVESARRAAADIRLRQGMLHVEMDRIMQLSWSPSDPYFTIDSQSAGYYQWGMHTMRFPLAWDKTRGHGYVGTIDGGVPNTIPPDLQQNYRPQFSYIDAHSPTPNSEYHGSHVLGIVAATVMYQREATLSLDIAAIQVPIQTQTRTIVPRPPRGYSQHPRTPRVLQHPWFRCIA